jgi:hypothetical protein
MAITAPTPNIIPRAVSKDLILFDLIASTAIGKLEAMFSTIRGIPGNRFNLQIGLLYLYSRHFQALKGIIHH